MLGSVFQIRVTARPGHTAEEIEAAVNQELDRFRQAGPDPREVERARNGLETQLLQGLETLGGFGGVSDQLNLYNHYLGDPGYLPKDLARYTAVTPATVKAFATEQLTNNKRVVVFGVPGDPDFGPEVPTPPPSKASPGTGAESINKDEPWRADIPKPAAARTLNLPLPKSFQLANGLTVIYSERAGMPIAAANLVVRTGSDANPVDKPGLANFTAAMLDEGTATRPALQIADEVAQIGASLTTGSTMDSSTVSVRSLQKNFPAALGLLADVVLAPSFPADEIERQRASRLASLVQQREDPNAVASRVMAAALYGPQHTYGYTEIGTEQSVKAMSRADMLNFWKQNFVPNNAALIVAGPMKEAEIRQLVEKTLGAWQRGTPVTRTAGTPATTSARVIIVDKPGSQQTQLRVAAVGVPRSTPDYAPLRATNEALGGLFSSRINLNLREEHGYTYGAGSQFVFRKGAGPFIVFSGVRTDVTAPAVSEIMKELTRVVDGPLTRDELTMAKDSLVRSLPSDFETSGNTVASMSNLFVYDLGLDYYAKYPQMMSAVDVEGAHRAARAHIVPGSMVVVAVGDRAKIEPELKKLNLGKIEVWSADAQPPGSEKR
jgi:zinc protease